MDALDTSDACGDISHVSSIGNVGWQLGCNEGTQVGATVGLTWQQSEDILENKLFSKLLIVGKNSPQAVYKQLCV